MSCFADSFTKSLKPCEDRIGGGSPLERFAVLIVVGDELVDSLNQLPDRPEGSAANRFVGDEAKESLGLIQPRTICRDEMHMPSRSCGQPDFGFQVLVAAVVVDHAVDVQIDRDRLSISRRKDKNS